LSDPEINRLLDFLTTEDALGEMKNLDRDFQFRIVKNKNEQELLVTMREAAAGDKMGFDSIIESEYRGIDDGQPNSMARELYLLVCCFYQHERVTRLKYNSSLCRPVLTARSKIAPGKKTSIAQ
jgi:hypothetical protein